MAQSGYTPILLYGSNTASNVPSPSNLTSSTSGVELALNYTDGRLYFKDNAGTVQLLAIRASSTSVVPTAGAIPYGTGTAYSFTAAGTSGQYLQSNGAGAPTWVTPAGGVTLSNDTATASNLYPTFASATSGSVSTIYTGNANLLYKPSTGELQSQAFMAINGLMLNNSTVNTSYTLPTGYNANSVGPMTIPSGIVVTIPSGSVWAII